MTGTIERDAGIDLVMRADWQRRARKFVINRIPRGWEGRFEEIREKMEKTPGFWPPHHPNAWGALCMYCIREGILMELDRSEQSATIRTNHARKAQVLRKTI